MIVVVAILASLAAMIFPNIMRVRISGNETHAQATLKTISVALESYLNINQTYPATTNVLLGGAAPYLSKDYFDGNIYGGYTFTAALTSHTYEITATPSSANQGTQTFVIATSGVFQ